MSHAYQTHRFLAVIALLSAVAVVSVQSARGAEIGRPQAGRAFAENACVECHIIAEGAKSRLVTGAPSFVTLARRPETTEFRLRVFFQTPHQVMPNFLLSPEQTDDLVAYILSLKTDPSGGGGRRR
jgi:mono/diheme cytochrome c family protein